MKEVLTILYSVSSKYIWSETGASYSSFNVRHLWLYLLKAEGLELLLQAYIMEPTNLGGDV